MKRFTLLLLLLLASVQVALYGLMWSRLLRDPSLRTMDFISMYGAGRLARTRAFALAYDTDASASVQREVVHAENYSPLIFNHPPYVLPLLALIAVDDYVQAYILWTALRLAILVMCARLILNLLRDSGWDLQSARLGTLGCVLFYPVFISLLGGQDTVFSLLGLLAWTFALLKSRDLAAGLGLGLATLAPTIAGALALPWIASRRRAALPFLGIVAGLGLYSFLLLGLEGIRKFLGLLVVSAEGSVYGIYWSSMYNLLGLLARLFPSVSPAALRPIGWAAAFLSILSVSLVWLRLLRPRLEHVGLAALAACFFSPHLNLHSLSFLLLPLLAFLVRLWRDGRRRLALLFIPALSTLLLLIGLLRPAWDFPFYYALMTLLAAALGWSLLRRCSAPEVDLGECGPPLP